MPGWGLEALNFAYPTAGEWAGVDLGASGGAGSTLAGIAAPVIAVELLSALNGTPGPIQMLPTALSQIFGGSKNSLTPQQARRDVSDATANLGKTVAGKMGSYADVGDWVHNIMAKSPVAGDSIETTLGNIASSNINPMQAAQAYLDQTNQTRRFNYGNENGVLPQGQEYSLATLASSASPYERALANASMGGWMGGLDNLPKPGGNEQRAGTPSANNPFEFALR